MASKKDKLANWLYRRKYVKTHEVVQWGIQNHYTSADRVKRWFKEKGYLRKLSDFEKKHKGFKGKDAIYEVKKDKLKEYLQPTLF